MVALFLLYCIQILSVDKSVFVSMLDFLMSTLMEVDNNVF